MIKVLEQGAFVSDKVAVVNFSGWERMQILWSLSSQAARQQLHHWTGELLNLFWGWQAGTTLSTARLLG